MIDIHPHVISDDISRFPPNPLGGVRSTWSAERPVTCEQLIEAMDEAGVEKAAVVQASTVYGHDNSYLAQCLERYRPRLAGVCSADFRAPDAVESIKKWTGDYGFSGARLFTAGSTMSQQSGWLDDPATHAAWEYVGDQGIPVCAQMTLAALPALRSVLTMFPRVRIILDHAARVSFGDGAPFGAAAPVFALASFGNVYIKVTSDTLRSASGIEGGPGAALKAIVGAFGGDHVAWGSNYPASPGTLAELVSLATEAATALGPEKAEWVLARTAMVLYPALQ